MLNSDELGEKGQAKFKELCVDGQLICNDSSGRDRSGWDFIVEFPFDASGVPLDKRPTQLACHVQLKTVWTRSNRIALKLQASEWLAKEAKPAFIAVLSVDPKLNFTSLHLIHVRGKALARMLHRLRETEWKGGKPQKAKITFDRTEGTEVPLSGAGLREALRRDIGKDMADYVAAKANELKSVGYERGRYELQTTITATRKELVEAFLDRRALKGVARGHFETRFGIRMPMKGIANGEVEISRLGPDDRCTLRAFDDRGGPPALFKGEVYFAPKALTGADGLRLRIHTPFFTLDIDDDKTQFATRPEVNRDSFTLEEWANFLRMMGALDQPSTRLVIRPEKDTPEIPFGLGRHTPDEDAKGARFLAQACEQAQELVKLTGEGQPISITYRELLDYVHEISHAYAVHQHNVAAIPELPLSEEPAAAVATSFDVIYANFIRFPEFTLAFGALCETRITSEGGPSRFQTTAIRKTRFGHIPDSAKDFETFVESVREGFGEMNVAMAVWPDREDSTSSAPT